MNECKNLKDITLHCFSIISKNGMSSEIEKHPEWKVAVTRNLAGSSSAISIQPIIEKGSPAKENAIYQ